MPARVPGHPGLKSGAAPMLLPEPELAQSTGPPSMQSELGTSTQAAAGREPGSGAGTGHDADLAVEDGLVLRHSEGYMPKNRDVLRRSEFLLPLSPAVVSMYKGALEAAAKR